MFQISKPEDNNESEDDQTNGSRPDKNTENEVNKTNRSRPDQNTESETEDYKTNGSKTHENTDSEDDQEEAILDDSSEMNSSETSKTSQLQKFTFGSGNISEIEVSLGSDGDRKLSMKGFKRIDVNLNEGAGGKEVHIWYKTSGFPPYITRIQLSFKEEMCQGLKEANYDRIDVNLNEGAKGNSIYLCFYKGCSEYDVPIENISITTSPDEEKEKFKSSWERLACNLNRRAGGNNIHLWVKRARPTYICDLDATEGFDKDAEMFKKGYIRIDEDTNRGTRGDYVFIWYRLTTDIDRAISDMQVSITKEEYECFRKAGYKLVNQDLNQKTKGPAVHLWYRKDQPITNFSLMVKETDLEKYKNVIQVIDKNLNVGNDGCIEYLWYYREESIRSKPGKPDKPVRPEIGGMAHLIFGAFFVFVLGRYSAMIL